MITFLSPLTGNTDEGTLFFWTLVKNLVKIVKYATVKNSYVSQRWGKAEKFAFKGHINSGKLKYSLSNQHSQLTIDTTLFYDLELGRYTDDRAFR